MTRYLEDLNSCTDPTTGDYLLIYDASAGSTDKDRKVNVSEFALTEAANTFTAAQTVNTSADASKLIIQHSSATRMELYASGTETYILLSSFDNNTGTGPQLYIQRNNDGSTPSAEVYECSTSRERPIICGWTMTAS